MISNEPRCDKPTCEVCRRAASGAGDDAQFPTATPAQLLALEDTAQFDEVAGLQHPPMYITAHVCTGNEIQEQSDGHSRQLLVECKAAFKRLDNCENQEEAMAISSSKLKAFVARNKSMDKAAGEFRKTTGGVTGSPS